MVAVRRNAVGVMCLVVVTVSVLAGCRPRPMADHHAPVIPPSVAGTASAFNGGSEAGSDSGSGSAPGSVNQQDVDNLNGILASVGGPVTSVRSAITADGATPSG
jgi:hypothetical protein